MRRCVLYLPPCAVVVTLLALLVVPSGGAGADPPIGDPSPGWVTVWGAAPITETPTSTCPISAGRTVRNIIRPTGPGTTARLRLSNAVGTGPLVVGSVTVGVVQAGATVRSGTSRKVTFGGAGSVTIPIGQQLVSDPVSLPVVAGADLAVSIYLPKQTTTPNVHRDAVQASYLSVSGNYVGTYGASRFTRTIDCWSVVDGIDVLGSPALTGAVVAFGDSITNGHSSTISTNRRWPDQLSRRLRAAGSTLSVVNAGIGGNRLLGDGGRTGLSGVHRFERDVLAEPGVRAVIVLIGANDLGDSGGPSSYESLTAGFTSVIDRAHAAGIAVYVSPLTPMLTTTPDAAGYHSLAAEQARTQIDTWLTSSSGADGVVDLATAIASVDDPRRLDPACDSGDHLHPNDTGYTRMGDAIPLDWFRLGVQST